MNLTQLYGIAPCLMYACCLSCVWVKFEPYVETKCFVSYSFDSISGAHESKEGHCRHRILYPLRLGLPFTNDVGILKLKVGLGLD